MVNYTRLQIKNMVMDELDLQDEVFISDDELNNYINKSIDRAEQEIIKINEDYFLTSAPLSIVQGTSDYSLPADIYAQKIRDVVYIDGTLIYQIKRIRDWQKFIKKAVLDLNPSEADYYRYMIKHLNTSPTAPESKLVLVPPAQETAPTKVTIWYIRNANRLTDDTYVLDIPEALNFIIAKTKEQCLAKEFGGTAPADALAETERQMALLVSTLTEAQPDNQNEVETDMTSYYDHN